LFHDVAGYVDKILRGASPATAGGAADLVLPNLKTRTRRLTVPQSISPAPRGHRDNCRLYAFAISIWGT
jgi:hypothetical protein